MTVGELQESMTDGTLHGLVRDARWRAFVDTPNRRVVVVDQRPEVPEPYERFTADEALALADEISAGPARAEFHMGDDLELSDDKLAVFGTELRLCANKLPGVF